MFNDSNARDNNKNATNFKIRIIYEKIMLYLNFKYLYYRVADVGSTILKHIISFSSLILFLTLIITGYLGYKICIKYCQTKYLDECLSGKNAPIYNQR